MDDDLPLDFHAGTGGQTGNSVQDVAFVSGELMQDLSLAELSPHRVDVIDELSDLLIQPRFVLAQFLRQLPLGKPIAHQEGCACSAIKRHFQRHLRSG
jgi:hypothetical protein